MSNYWKNWAKATAIRSIKTMAETALSLFSVGQVIAEVPWNVIVSASVVAGVYCMLTCIKGLPEVKPE